MGIGMYLSLFSMPTDKTPWALIKEFDKFEEKINNDIITILENLEQKQESKVREAVKQISRKQGQPKEQINILDELEIAQKKTQMKLLKNHRCN
ncbi:MAG: hypothetical protein MZV65_15330 [Chromatiales bacterium]|nr:hypothetical protein [Chromatiales bacterium]